MIVHANAIEPAKPLVELRASVSEFPVVAPDVKLSDGLETPKVKVDEPASTVTAIGDEVITVPPLLPVTVTLRAPLVPAVVLIVTTLAPVPPDVSATDAGLTEHVSPAVPLELVTEHVRATVPAKVFSEANATFAVLPVFAPDAKLSDEFETPKVKVGAPASTVTAIADEVTTVPPLLPVTVTFRTPLVPIAVLIVIGLAPIPPDASTTDGKPSEHVPAAVPLELVTEHVRATVPAKVFTEANATLALLPVVAPDTTLSVGFETPTVNVGAPASTVTAIVDEVITVLPLVPVTVTFRTPLVPAVVLIVTTLVPVPPDARTTDTGLSEHLPAAVPLALVTEHVRATVPAKVSTEASATLAVLLVVAPDTTVKASVPGVTVKVAFSASAAARKLATSREPSPVARS